MDILKLSDCQIELAEMENVPVVDVSHDFISCCLWVLVFDIFCYPIHDVVFEGVFDDLMKKIRSKKLMDISTRK